MTEENMRLIEVVQKSDDGDFLKMIAETALQRIMDADVDNMIGAGRHERSPDRLTYRRHHVVPSGPSAAKSEGGYESWANDSSRRCRPGGFGGDRAQ
jgi:hypothetical protein